MWLPLPPPGPRVSQSLPPFFSFESGVRGIWNALGQARPLGEVLGAAMAAGAGAPESFAKAPLKWIGIVTFTPLNSRDPIICIYTPNWDRDY